MNSVLIEASAAFRTLSQHRFRLNLNPSLSDLPQSFRRVHLLYCLKENTEKENTGKEQTGPELTCIPRI